MVTTQKIAPCLWFDTQAEDAARYYVSVFKNSRIVKVSHYGKEGFEIHHRPAGSVMVVEFEIEGQRFVALNGGPQFKFSEAVSFQIPCETQKEIDYYVDRLSEGGEIGPCGWLKDKFGLSWQIFPTSLPAMMSDPDTAKSSRAMRAMLGMKKIDLAQLQAAYEGR